MQVLYAQFGYLLRNKSTGVLTNKVYLPDGVDTSNYEQITREDIDLDLYTRVSGLQDKEESLTKVAKVVARSVTDDVVALEIQEFYDIWQEGVKYVKDQYVRHNDILFKVLTEHTSQADWTPDTAASLFAKVLADPTGENIFEWQQPDSTNPYMKGDKVIHNGITYESLTDNNSWEPGLIGTETLWQ